MTNSNLMTNSSLSARENINNEIRRSMPNQNQDKIDAAIATIMAAAEKFNGPIICRDEVPVFMGRAISVGHLANLDSQGKGPKVSFKMGRRQCYSLDSLVSWLISRLEV